MKPIHHLRIVQVIGIFSGLLSGGIVIGFGIFYRNFVIQNEWMFVVLFFGSFIISQILFRTYIAPNFAADCPQCRGKAYLSGHKIYTCSVCGHNTDLNLWGRKGKIGKKVYAAAEKAETRKKADKN